MTILSVLPVFFVINTHYMILYKMVTPDFPYLNYFWSINYRLPICLIGRRWVKPPKNIFFKKINFFVVLPILPLFLGHLLMLIENVWNRITRFSSNKLLFINKILVINLFDRSGVVIAPSKNNFFKKEISIFLLFCPCFGGH